MEHMFKGMEAGGDTKAMLEEACLAFGLTARVTEVKGVEGTASITSSRGATKHIFDYNFELEWEIKSDPPPEGMGEEVATKSKTYKGSLKYADVVSPTTADVTVSFKKAPSATARKRIDAALEALKKEVLLYTL